MLVDDVDQAHTFCIQNGNMAGPCGCFYCEATFDASEIVNWIHDENTALCPKCGIDSVIPGDKVRIDPEFLSAMYDRWFKIAWPLKELGG